MPTLRKQRSDATLKTLPEVVQEQLFALIRTKSYAEVRKIAAEKWQIETSAAALSEFFRWYPVSRRLQTAASVADEVARTLRELGGVQLDDEQISKASQAVFEARAIREGDSEEAVAWAKIRLARQKGERDARRIALLEKKAAQADEAAGVAADDTLTDEQRSAKLRQIFRMG